MLKEKILAQHSSVFRISLFVHSVPIGCVSGQRESLVIIQTGLPSKRTLLLQWMVMNIVMKQLKINFVSCVCMYETVMLSTITVEYCSASGIECLISVCKFVVIVLTRKFSQCCF